jgi:hypothetical protein
MAVPFRGVGVNARQSIAELDPTASLFIRFGMR